MVGSVPTGALQKGTLLYSAVSSPRDCSKRFTLHPWLQSLREEYSFRYPSMYVASDSRCVAFCHCVMAEHAVAAFRALSGVFCIYKPAGRSMKQVVSAIKTNLVKDFNALPCRPVRPRVVFQENNSSSGLPIPTTVPDLADHPLVVGPRYIDEDFTVRYVSRLEHDASGVVVMGIGASRGLLSAIAAAQYVRVYHVVGQLGTATQDFRNTGRIVEKTTYHHVTHGKIDKVIAAMQAGHQRHMYQ
ncbi:Mitochondrial mRNA pseudouridine synthase TRUB2 [Lamellibrachia satsuma]|nr:Mitochondrial mRNA pseudouridine synthase TRUB2 [Lamellibrachia satsuma]